MDVVRVSTDAPTEISPKLRMLPATHPLGKFEDLTRLLLVHAG